MTAAVVKLPPSALRAATSLWEGGKKLFIDRVVTMRFPIIWCFFNYWCAGDQASPVAAATGAMNTTSALAMTTVSAWASASPAALKYTVYSPASTAVGISGP